MIRIRAIVLAAQEEEVRPVLAALEATATKPAKMACPVASAWVAASTHGNTVILKTGIGLVATASVLGWALARFSPKVVLFTGTAGGLAPDIRVGDVVVGTSYTYGTADATAFGYAPGQIPGQPAVFQGAEELLEHCPLDVKRGQMLSGDSFVTARNIGDMRSKFPDALTTDMETTAAAQVCAAWNVPFIAVRCVSDLCGPSAEDDYHMELDHASELSAEATLALLAYLAEPVPSGPNQKFSKELLTLGLLTVFARVRNLDPVDPREISDDLREDLVRNLPPQHVKHLEVLLGLAAAAELAIKNNPELTLTAKQYDQERSKLASEVGVDTGRGKLAWPPTSQTIIKRFNGYWNDALDNVGLRSQLGRKRGGLKFSDQDYIHALRSFSIWSAKRGISPSYKAYQQWIKDTGRRGGVPSGAAIRQRFGSWRTAAHEAQI
ncbi:5'-methylthioadenosine/S-adenosylhomocysteine nucleosidase [Changpingibacter yushuensis]|uniref:5'-methylthioadenosine/S-adenosylhomocysteine nucleosidase n=1 Tax=Changpingibacter yushuensis TaxID=2758440 RepID=UPI001FEA4DC6|nr:5'-methylthioadenosine/S-adenosylhomocysteine nucleosidase [Changpingibacter yushuensis]